MIRFSSCNTSEEKKVQSAESTHEAWRLQGKGEKVSERESALIFFLQTPKIDGFALFSTSSGSVSSFNDDDYEVDENSDEEEQEEPGDYCKGTQVAKGL